MSVLDEGYTNYKKRKDKCPICGHENTRAWITEEYYTVEDFYVCDNCTYFEYMCYCSPIYGISEHYDKRYENEVRDQEIKVFSDEEYYHIPL